jgi:predicted PurR-regulated permease PerM
VRLGKWVGLIALLISLYILWQIRQVLLLVFMAVVFATPLNRLVKRLRKSGAGRGLATILAISFLITFLTILGIVIVPPFIGQFRELAMLVPEGFEQLRTWIVLIQDRIAGTNFTYIPRVDELIRQGGPLGAWLFNNFFSLFSDFLTIVLNMLLVLILTVMFLVNPQPYRQGFTQLFPSFYRKRIDTILSQCEIALVSWVRGILIDMVVIGLVSGIGLWILQVRLVFANAALAGLFEAIPNVGPTLSLIPPVAIALLDAPWKAGAVIILYIGIQQLEQYFLVPFVMAKQVSLLPAITLLSQVIFTIFFGFLGLFLAIPLVIIGQIWIREVVVRDVLDPWNDRKKEAQLEAAHQLDVVSEDA